MGFFSDLLGTALPILGGALTAVTGGTALAGAIGALPQSQALAAIPVAAAANAAAQLPVATNGSLRKRTIVETFDPRTGQVTKRDAALPGAPAVMRSDVVAANRLDREITKLNKRRKKKVVKQSPAAALKDELELAQLRSLRRQLDAPAGTTIVRVEDK